MFPSVPRTCQICRAWGRDTFCPRCRAAFAASRPRCSRCALPLSGDRRCPDCIRKPWAFDAAVAAVDYLPPWDGVIAQLKFRGQAALARPLAALLQDAVQCNPTALQPGIDWLLPVPLSAERLRERGYNQAWELCKPLARRLRLRADARLLHRVQQGERQTALDRVDRLAGLRGAFAVEPSRRREVAGCHVALVDDVMTTGATLSAAAAALKQAGAAFVTCWAVARTPAPGEGA